MSVVFALLVVSAPLVYLALSTTTLVQAVTAIPATTPGQPAGANDASDFQSRGTPGGFLLATLLTVWAVFGQVVTLYVFLGNIAGSTAFHIGLAVVFVAALLVVVRYVGRVIPSVLNFQADKARIQYQQQRTSGGHPPPLPYWHLL